MNPKKKQKIEIIGLLVGIWFILSLPLPWLITIPDVAQQQLLIILQMTGLISIPFVGLAIAWTLKPELANRDLKYD
jgi:MFS-type transporter involved in bile tolerance (Atg22 family)